ncbi:GTPase domain-containing protein [Mucilaginibacter sp. JRF]|uniref:GTPase domain-containing protein n=1 Tax=Mucilaginibacter sp. JRF TaxID=2780088 RepID=UPI001880AF75|nr:GTPase domain-containing protein [Mucilaginibacter sp. JRF]MBE9583657.1 GTPase domain-containing protein [Mucilaginibacter sp. JRF]
MASCDEEGCKVAINGKCINNLPLDTCPHYNFDEPNSNELNSQTIESDVTNETELPPIDKVVNKFLEDVVDVYSGKALELYDVNQISLSGVTKLIMLAGMPDAGKTTLILSLMHLFQTQPFFSDFIFAGSKTLLDFEEKAHPSKIDSDNDEPETNRTPDIPPQFLHIKLQNTKSLKTSNVLFTDISGEKFRAIKDSTETAKKFKLALRADSFVLFFDTKRVTSFEERASSKTSALGILRSLTEAQTLLPHTKIQIVFSRWDLFSNDEDEALHNEFISLLKNDIEKLLKSNYNLSYFEVAARPSLGEYEFGYGIEDLLKAWFESDMSVKINEPLRKSVELDSSRQFLNYQFVQ